MVGKEDIKKLIEVFYQAPFKTFYINSNDGMTFINPLGVFVSLGITTSMKTLENLCDIINNTRDYKAKLVEISSVKVAGQYLNYITSETPSQISVQNKEQGYNILRQKGDMTSTLFDQSECLIELEGLKNILYPDQDIQIVQEYTPKIITLQKIITRVEEEGGWNSFYIIKTDTGDYKLFHRNMNYINCGDIEYRIGIFVAEK